MFSFQFGTFESSTPGWFDWLNLFVAGMSVLTAYWLAERSFKKEQNAQKKKEFDRAVNDFNLFEKFLLKLKEDIQSQVKNIEKVQSQPKVLILSYNLNSEFLNYLDVNTIYHHYPTHVGKLNNLLIIIKKLNNFNDNLESESIKFTNREYDTTNTIRNSIQKIDLKYYELTRIYNFSEKLIFINKNITNEQLLLKEIFEIRSKFSSNSINQDINLEFIIENYIKKISDIIIHFDFYEAKYIQVICNDILNEYQNLQELYKNHFVYLNNKLNFLKVCDNEIDKYLKN